MKLGLIVAGLAVAAVVLLLGTLVRPAGEARAAANQLLTEQRCVAQGSTEVAFAWTGNGLLLTEQWFDISSSNSFAAGTFTGMRLAGGWVQSLTLTLDDAATFYVRLNQLNVNGQWDPSPVFTVQTIACPAVSYSLDGGEADEEADERRARLRNRDGSDQLSDAEAALLLALICHSIEEDDEEDDEVMMMGEEEDDEDFFQAVFCDGEEDDD